MIWDLVFFFVLLVLSGFFSSAEIAMMSLTRLQVQRMVKRGDPQSHVIARLKSDPHKLLTTILIGNNLVNIAAAALATAIAIRVFQDAGVGIATGITTVLVLFFGEIIPKGFAITHRKRLARVIAPLLAGLQWLLTPIIVVVDSGSRAVLRLFGEPEQDRITEEALRDVVLQSEREGGIKKAEREMITRVLRFDDLKAAEIMTPRLDVFCLEMHRPLSEVLPEIMEEGYSRIPVYNKRMDKVAGVVLVKDVLRAVAEGKESATLKGVMQEVLFVPEQKKLDQLLREFQARKMPFAIVVDEHGLFIGVVTVEDVLEELVGEIYDENDDRHRDVRRLDKDSLLVSGKTPVVEIREHGYLLPEDEDYDTVAGLLMHRLGRVPAVGDSVRVDGLVVTVKKASGQRIILVRVSKG